MSAKTEWNHKIVADAWKIDFRLFLLRDTPWWVNNCGIFVLFRSTFFPQKLEKLYMLPKATKLVDIKGPSINTRTSLLKSAEASSLFFFLCIYMRGIGKLFKLKTRSFRLTLNSRLVFKNHHISRFENLILEHFFKPVTSFPYAV